MLGEFSNSHKRRMSYIQILVVKIKYITLTYHGISLLLPTEDVFCLFEYTSSDPHVPCGDRLHTFLAALLFLLLSTVECFVYSTRGSAMSMTYNSIWKISSHQPLSYIIQNYKLAFPLCFLTCKFKMCIQTASVKQQTEPCPEGFHVQAGCSHL